MWISVKDRLPEHGEAILVYSTKSMTGDPIITTCRIDRHSFSPEIWMDGYGFGGYEWEYDFDWKDITHWMPLPSPPTEERK